jgi:hypothetical protein
VDELTTAIEAVRKIDDRAIYGMGRVGFYGTMVDASRVTKADPEFVKLCLHSLRQYQNGKIDRKHFDEACEHLDYAARQFKTNRDSN